METAVTDLSAETKVPIICDGSRIAARAVGHCLLSLNIIRRTLLPGCSVALLDLSSGLYITIGSGMKSGKEKFYRVMPPLSTFDIKISSVHPDRCCSSPSYFGKFGDTKDNVVPKSNVKLNGMLNRKHTVNDSVVNTIPSSNSTI